MTDKSTKDYSGAAWDELYKLAGKATPGPWIAIDRHFEPRYVGKPENGVDTCGGYFGVCEPDHVNDVEFIAAANPQAIKTLIDELRAALKRVEELEAGMRKLRTYPWGSSSFMERQAFNAELDELLPQPPEGTTKA